MKRHVTQVLGYGLAGLVGISFMLGTALADASSASPTGSGSKAGQGASEQSKKQGKAATDLTEGEQAVPDEYSTTPVRQGALQEVKDSKWLNKTVTNQQGEKLGTIKKVLKDQKTQDIEYVFMEIAGARHARPVQWSQIQQQGDKLTMKATKDELLPSVSREDVKDMSPDLAAYMDEIEDVRDDPKPKVGDDPARATDRPVPSTGTMGEQRAAGDLGPRGAPAGEAPQFEGEGSKNR